MTRLVLEVITRSFLLVTLTLMSALGLCVFLTLRLRLPCWGEGYNSTFEDIVVFTPVTGMFAFVSLFALVRKQLRERGIDTNVSTATKVAWGLGITITGSFILPFIRHNISVGCQ